MSYICEKSVIRINHNHINSCKKSCQVINCQNLNLEWQFYYRNKRHIQVLYDGFKLFIGYIKATKPEGLSALIQQIDSLKPS